MCKNHGVAYIEPGVVEVREIEYPKLALGDRKCEHGVILKIVSTNICGSDQHMVRGRTTAPAGLVLGHEITGLVIEAGRDVEFIKVGDLVSVPFNIACGRCRNCKAGQTGICLNVNPARPGAAYGYVDMGGWVGGQAEYVMVPYADFNLLKFPDSDQAMEKIRDLTLLTDIFPTGFHGAVTAGVGPGSIVYIAGAGPVGLACAASCHLLGAAVVIVGDMIDERLAQARSFGCETIDLKKEASLADQIAAITGTPEVDSAVDCVGFEAKGHGHNSNVEQPATVLNSIMEITRAGGQLGVPGLYVTGDPGAVDEAAKKGSLSIRIGLGWAKSHSIHTGQCPVMKYHRQLMNAILYDKVKIAAAVNVEVITLNDSVRGYHDFDKGAAKKFVIDPHGMIRA
ncbi:glutathione-independent formaldehyde dehydrogenase [Chitinophaga ginsengisegetis]|uniref:Glutathione-independent formaldehyde dehydrogenase n=1 Tax=Chitinophaga ginsengisegetis TaxID=393003 RepID=A0A1T5P9F8_9BACT|nr:formaldehyde dehydrogenase, glutathione-independent [Chitinophaga ginsengisegetis]MDR6570782.1 glutathione-independent formaldehyde dehydrogenase [Chitinophaga ginsengisegetis]MDR6650516.1 glutathione-independent formaldehyde dehydrogenase [Chitinophaga ginsengisegetis]MDR6656845.1 glutathione-independent formaldehyde dehydrogenase [Chitinophaga ginsengisegetis]SKD09257.1 glutathione-independent formaldehyde dehydrogenase [Chitinophaga ginsengisegetis]